jgi:hypothetical protein
MSDTNDFYNNLKGLSEDFQSLRDENQALRTRLATFAEQAELVVRTYDGYLEAKVDGRRSDSKDKSDLLNQYLSGLSMLAQRERLTQ